MDTMSGWDASYSILAGIGLVYLVSAVVIWLVIAIIAAQVATTKGYSAAGGFLAGLFLGPLGLIIYGCCGDQRVQRHLSRLVQLKEHETQVQAVQTMPPPVPPAPPLAPPQ